MADSQDIRPVPDPTLLTNEAVLRLETTLRIVIKREIDHLHELLELASNRQQELFGEKLIRIDLRFDMLDARTAEQKQDTTNALNAALAAQKEAVAAQTASSEKSITKSETATIERIKGVETLLATSTKATDDKITDLKDRVIAIEAVKLGNVEQAANMHTVRDSMRGTMAIIISLAAAMITAASVIVAIIVATKH